MKKHPDKSRLMLYALDELSARDAAAVRRHLATCDVCIVDVADTEAVRRLLAANRPDPSERDLVLLRNSVMRAVRSDQPAESLATRVAAWLGLSGAPAWRPALAGAFVAIVALAAGFAAYPMLVGGDEGPSSYAPAAYDPFRTPSSDNGIGSAQVLNVKILSKDDATGAVEFEFEALFKSTVSGNLSDPAIQSILARALVSSQNPGVRLRAVNVFSESLPERVLSDPMRERVKESLISAVLYDENHGVRLEALRALSEYIPDSAATAAVIRVLTTDKNSAIKIAAISTLDLSKFGQGPVRDRLSEVLKQRSLTDENNYIRIKARAALQEVQQ